MKQVTYSDNIVKRPYTRRQTDDDLFKMDKFRSESDQIQQHYWNLSDFDDLKYKLEKIQETDSNTTIEEYIRRTSGLDRRKYKVNLRKSEMSLGYPDPDDESDSSYEELANHRHIARVVDRFSRNLYNTLIAQHSNLSVKSIKLNRPTRRNESFAMGGYKDASTNTFLKRKEIDAYTDPIVGMEFGMTTKPIIETREIGTIAIPVIERRIFTGNTVPLSVLKDVACNTAANAPTRDNTCNTQTLQVQIDCTCNTDIKEYKNKFAAANTSDKCVDSGFNTTPRDQRDAAVNTNIATENTDDTCNTDKIDTKECSCEAKIVKCGKDISCYTKIPTTDSTCNTCLKCKTSTNNTEPKVIVNVSCNTESGAKSVSETTQKSRIEGVNLSIRTETTADIKKGPSLEKSKVLCSQLLPPINIVSQPTFQKILQFNIDQEGNTNIEFILADKKIGFSEVQYTCSEKCLKSEEIKLSQPVVSPQKEADKEQPLENRGTSVTFKKKPLKTLEPYVTASQPSFDATQIENIVHRIKSVVQRLDLDTQKSSDVLNVPSDGSDIMEERGDKREVFTLGEISKIKPVYIVPANSIEGRHYVSTTPIRSGDTDSYKNLVLQSFNIYDNQHNHDPGEVTTMSMNLLKVDMDDNVYKTFINPEGQASKRFTDSDLTASKTFSARSLKMNETANKSINNLKKMKETKEKIEKREGHMELPFNVLDIGLYDTKETQCDIPPKPVAETKREKKTLSSEKPIISGKEVKDRISVEKEVLTAEKKTLRTEKEPTSEKEVAPKKSSFETISLTITYSTDDSLSDQQSNVSVERVSQTSDKTKGKPNFSTEAEETFKSLKLKMSKNPALLKTSSTEFSALLNENDNEDEDSARLSFSGGQIYASNIIQRSSEEIKKFIPRIKRSMRNSKLRQEMRESDGSGVTQKSTEILKESSEDMRKKESKAILIMQVHTQGDSVLIDKKRVVDDLYVGRNGRYRDEKNLFYENALQELQQKSDQSMDFSTSSDTTERSFSEGEIHCYCSVSNGEIHICKRGSRVKNVKSPKLYPNDMAGKKVGSRRNYLNNMITYYFNQNNCDTSSTS